MFLDDDNVATEAALKVFGLDGDAQDIIDTIRHILKMEYGKIKNIIVRKIKW